MVSFSCKKQLVSFVATSLTEPDIFGTTGLTDLTKCLGVGSGGGNCDPSLVFLMKELAAELETLNRLESVPNSFLLVWFIDGFMGSFIDSFVVVV